MNTETAIILIVAVGAYLYLKQRAPSLYGPPSYSPAQPANTSQYYGLGPSGIPGLGYGIPPGYQTGN